MRRLLARMQASLQRRHATNTCTPVVPRIIMARTPSPKLRRQLLTALVANSRGEIFDLEGYAAVGRAGPVDSPLTVSQTCPLPSGGELMFLPDRAPVVYNLRQGKLETLYKNPSAPAEPLYPVAAFNSPGFVLSSVSAYRERGKAGYLPLFAYGAVGWHRGEFRTAAICVDRERRQDLRLMTLDKILAGVDKVRRHMPANRLRSQLESCALKYGCPAGKNFFLGRYEAPLPVSRRCNARCLGCISHQPDQRMPICQPRIAFTPTAKEIAEVALYHIRHVNQAIVSFGQGCEGDPLMAAEIIAPAIRLIRSQTADGTINMNTNGSRPKLLQRLLGAGLDSVRISINSAREPCYMAYYQPRGYRFGDVLHSIDLAFRQGQWVSINYLNCPGFTDGELEQAALIQFLQQHPINMIQWRNLNFDPLRYWRLMQKAAPAGTPVGMQALITQIQTQFSEIKMGYFNPPKEKFGLQQSTKAGAKKKP